MAGGTFVARCYGPNCTGKAAKFQDGEYGDGQRTQNIVSKARSIYPSTDDVYGRCTACLFINPHHRPAERVASVADVKKNRPNMKGKAPKKKATQKEV